MAVHDPSGSVDDPEFTDAEGGVGQRFAAQIVIERRIRDLDGEEDVRSADIGETFGPREDD